MNIKQFICVVCVLFITHKSFSQKKEKIKGNREVTLNVTELDAFNAINLNDNFEIELLEGNTNSVEIETDSNLHEVIEFEVIDSILRFSKNKRISSKKKLRILVSFSSGLNEINLSENSEIRSVNSLDIDSLSLKTADNTKTYLNVTGSYFEMSSSGKAKVKLNIQADSSEFNLTENSKLDGSITGESSKFNIYQRSITKLDGSVNNVAITLDGNGYFNAPELNINTLNINASISSDAKVNVIEQVNIDASGNSEIYLYGNPKININSFFDSAKLQKKEK